jgi:hypothetical protein
MTTFATLPRELEIDGITHVQHWRTQNYIVYQNYTTPIEHGGELLAHANQVSGQNLFHVFAVEKKDGGESLGQELATFTDLQPAMNDIARRERLA